MADSDFIEDPILRAKALREYPYDFPYYDWCLTALEIDRKCDLHKLKEWNTSLQRLCDVVGCKTVLWSSDLEQSHFVFVLARGTVHDNLDDGPDSVWAALDRFMSSPPRTRQIVLNIEDRYPGPSEVHELVLIDGNQDLITHQFLHNVDFFTEKTTPMISHDPPEELAGCARGIIHSDTDERNTIAILYTWPGMGERERLMDPIRKSCGGATEYEDIMVSPMRRFKREGAAVESHLLRLHRWYPADPAKHSRRRCIML